MTHSEKRTVWWKEGMIGLGTGVLYGTTSVLVGHPFDTIKTKMQAQSGFERTTMVQSFAKTIREGNIKGLYRGATPPLLGSGIYRSMQFAAFEGVYTYLGEKAVWSKHEIPCTGGLQVRVLLAGVFASTVRSLIETPLEVAKVRKQVNSTWQFRHLYSGFVVTWLRCQGLMNTYFITVDSLRRHYPDIFASPILGPFLISGCAATLGWWVVWPLEHMKSQIQGEYGRKQSLVGRIRLVMRERGGFFALYRGLAPGTIRSFLANGSSMVVMAFAQRKVTEWGLRN